MAYTPVDDTNLRGNPTAPNQAPLTSNARVANTKYVDDAVTAGGGGGGNALTTDTVQTVVSGGDKTFQAGLNIDGDNGGYLQYNHADVFVLAADPTSTVIGSDVDGEAGNRWRIRADGRFTISDGSGGGGSVVFERIGNGSLTIDAPTLLNLTGPIKTNGLRVGQSAVKTSNVPATALSDNLVALDSTGGGFSLTVTSPAADGQTFTFKDVGGDATANPIVLTPNGGATIDGQATLSIDVDRGAATLVYSLDDNDWRVTASYQVTQPPPVPPTPVVDDSIATDDNTFGIFGSNLDVVNHVFTNGTLTTSYYDPAGPDAGSNPGTATIVTWNSSTIEITDTAQDGQTISSVHMWGVADSPDYGTFDFDDYVVS